MELKKYLFMVTLIVALAVNSYAQSHHMSVGTKHNRDILLLDQVIKEDSKYFRKVVIEKTFSVSGQITQIVAEDQKTNGNGAYASVLNGGPGQREVKMKFKSQRGHGINFRLKIFGY